MNIKPESFFFDLYRDNEIRKIRRRDYQKDVTQFSKNLKLQKEEHRYIQKYINTDLPIIFIVGSPRSGTTLLSQILVANYNLGYFLNSVAKYYMCPINGLIKSGYKSEEKMEVGFSSSFGNTELSNNPHEMGYFWQYWFNHNGNDELNKAELDKVDWEQLKNQIYGYAGYFNKPLLIKSLPYINYKIERISKEFKNSSFIYMSRNLEDVVVSILKTRYQFYENYDQWWSIRPRNIKQLEELRPVDQIVGQVDSVTKSIERSLAKVDSNRVFNITYESLIQDPEESLKNVFSIIKRKHQPFKVELNKSTKTELPISLKKDIDVIFKPNDI